jgi:chromate transporter
VPGTIGHRGSALEVLRVFTKLGLTGFGGPVAHLGYFRTELVERRKWVDEAHYVDIVALCQFLPGPASSQTGISLGILRAGLPGALAAWIGFSGPSVLAMIQFRYGVARLGDIALMPWLHGLKIVAVAVVAQAVWGMARNPCPDRERRASRSAPRCSPSACRWRRGPDRRDRGWRTDRLVAVSRHRN